MDDLLNHHEAHQHHQRLNRKHLHLLSVVALVVRARQLHRPRQGRGASDPDDSKAAQAPNIHPSALPPHAQA